MNQGEVQSKALVSEWRGVNQRVSSSLILPDQIIATMGVALNNTMSIARIEGKKLVHKFEGRITTIFEVGENLIIQTDTSVWSFNKEEFLQLLQFTEAEEDTFTYISGEDTNGVFYFLGTAKGLTAWVNPQLNGQLSVSGDTDATGTKSLLTNRTSDVWKSVVIPAPSVTFDLGEGVRLELSVLTIRASSSPSENPEHIALEGSNDGVNWIGLFQISHLVWTADEWKNWTINSTTPYRYFRLIHSIDGLNHVGIQQEIDHYIGDGFEGYSLGVVSTLTLTEYNTIEDAIFSTGIETAL